MNQSGVNAENEYNSESKCWHTNFTISNNISNSRYDIIYKVKNVSSNFSTDIASGAKSCIYPPKYRHWGQAYVENEYDTSILIRNNSHKPLETKDGEGTLTIYGQEEIFTIRFKVKAESSISIPLFEKIHPFCKKSEGCPNFLSWIIDLDVPTCETFWISYRKTDGAIFGEHGF